MMHMNMVAYVLLAYFLIGLSFTTRSLRGGGDSGEAQPAKEGIGWDLIHVLLWPFKNRGLALQHGGGGKVRRILQGFLAAVTQWSLMIGLILLSNEISKLFLTASLLRMSAVFAFLMLVVVFVPMDVWVGKLIRKLIARFSGGRQAIAVPSIQWCGTCRHHRKMSEYEDVKSGLWHNTTMPDQDQLPCRIITETGDVWQTFYATDPMSRTIFPKNCPEFLSRG